MSEKTPKEQPAKKPEKVEAPKTLLEALHQAQSVIPIVGRNATNPHFGKNYADLSAIWEAARGPMRDAGLVFFGTLQRIASQQKDGFGAPQPAAVPAFVGHLVHVATGQELTTEFPVDLAAARGPQGIGSVLTYARRYSLCALLGIVVEAEDDDGERAQGAQGARREQRPQAQQQAIQAPTEDVGF